MCQILLLVPYSRQVSSAKDRYFTIANYVHFVIVCFFSCNVSPALAEIRYVGVSAIKGAYIGIIYYARDFVLICTEIPGRFIMADSDNPDCLAMLGMPRE